MELPPRPGRRQSFPELDRAAWFAIPGAREKILKGQAVFLDRLIAATEGQLKLFAWLLALKHDIFGALVLAQT